MLTSGNEFSILVIPFFTENKTIGCCYFTTIDKESQDIVDGC
ncbi:hypothetical protein [Megasphaera lornae]|nr:hypothetical protein [Megasphaera genomosp. type_1]